MTFGFDDSTRKFIATELVGRSGEKSEEKVWKAVNLCKCITYWQYPFFSRAGENYTLNF